jgi:hypothetical protein
MEIIRIAVWALIKSADTVVSCDNNLTSFVRVRGICQENPASGMMSCLLRVVDQNIGVLKNPWYLCNRSLEELCLEARRRSTCREKIVEGK